MSKKRKSYSNEFKFKVALAALKGNKTLSQLSILLPIKI
jgi:transposase-like protein